MPSVYVIAEPCVDVMDKSCIEVCPVDPDECTGCNLCLPACPVGAIYTADEIPAGSRAWVEVNALWFKDKAAARARVHELAG